MAHLVYTNYTVEKAPPPVATDPEFDALYRIARRNGFKAKDLAGRDSRYLSTLIACRDIGLFPRSLKGMPLSALEARLDEFHGLHQPPGA